MKLLVRIHVTGDNDNGVNAAEVELNDSAIKHIFQLSKKAGNNNTISEFDYSPELGWTELNLEDNDLDKGYTLAYRDLDRLPSGEVKGTKNKKPKVFVFETDARKDCVMLNVNDTDFWWEGYFKHTDIKWDTSPIPLSFLYLKVKVKSAPKKKSDLNMTAAEMNAIHEKIAAGINQGLNAREIVDTFQRHITKAQLVRVIWELLERSH
jgi:hypothetical protein